MTKRITHFQRNDIGYHSLLGPAISYSDGSKEYWADGVQYSKEDWDKNIEEELYEFFEYENGNKEYLLNNITHRLDGPAIIWFNGDQDWKINGKFHREDGPAREFVDGNKEWWLNDKKYTEEEWKIEMEKRRGLTAEIPIQQPEIISEPTPDTCPQISVPQSDYCFTENYVKDDDGEFWRENGEWHREGGPAIIWKDGTKEWWKNGFRHRDDGPAIEYSDSLKGQEWWVNGKLHRVDGPAIYSRYNDEWLINGVYHSRVGPAIRKIENGEEKTEYYIYGQRLKELTWKRNVIFNKLNPQASFLLDTGPKDKHWYNSEGKLHRLNGPALITENKEEWYINGQKHREDGPATIYADGSVYYCLNDKTFYSLEEFEAELKKLKSHQHSKNCSLCLDI